MGTDHGDLCCRMLQTEHRIVGLLPDVLLHHFQETHVHQEHVLHHHVHCDADHIDGDVDLHDLLLHFPNARIYLVLVLTPARSTRTSDSTRSRAWRTSFTTSLSIF